MILIKAKKQCSKFQAPSNYTYDLEIEKQLMMDLTESIRGDCADKVDDFHGTVDPRLSG